VEALRSCLIALALGKRNPAGLLSEGPYSPDEMEGNTKRSPAGPLNDEGPYSTDEMEENMKRSPGPLSDEGPYSPDEMTKRAPAGRLD
jgi:hypothetical protein